MNEMMTEKQAEYIRKLAAALAQKAHDRYQAIIFNERSYNTWTEDRAQLTFENHPELFVAAGFWRRAVPTNMTKRQASMLIDMMRNGDPVHVLNHLIDSGKMNLFGEEAVNFVMSFAKNEAAEEAAEEAPKEAAEEVAEEVAEEATKEVAEEKDNAMNEHPHKHSERKRFFNITRESIDAGEAFIVVDDNKTAVMRLRDGVLEVANVEVPQEFQQLPAGWYECPPGLAGDKTIWQIAQNDTSVLNKTVLVEEYGETYFARLARDTDGRVTWQVLENDNAQYIIDEHFDDFDYARGTGVYFVTDAVAAYIDKYEDWTDESAE